MATAPYGVRLLVGAATMAVEETIRLPKTILMYPMTLASTAAQVVMRIQQDVAELVIKGDATLEHMFPPKDEQPEWATFDEDLPTTTPGRRRPGPRTASAGPRDGSRCTAPANAATGPSILGASCRRAEQAVGVCAGGGRGTGLRAADPGPVAGPAANPRRRRARGPAGLRRGHQRRARRSRRCLPTGSPARRRSDRQQRRRSTAIRPRIRFRFARSRRGSRPGSTSWARSGSKVS